MNLIIQKIVKVVCSSGIQFHGGSFFRHGDTAEEMGDAITSGVVFAARETRFGVSDIGMSKLVILRQSLDKFK